MTLHTLFFIDVVGRRVILTSLQAPIHYLTQSYDRQTLTSPSDGVLYLVGIKRALFTSDNTCNRHWSTVKSKSVCSPRRETTGAVLVDLLLLVSTTVNIQTGMTACHNDEKSVSTRNHCCAVQIRHGCWATGTLLSLFP